MAVASDLIVSIPSSRAHSDTELAHPIVARNLTGIRGVSSETNVAAKRVSADSASEGAGVTEVRDALAVVF